MAEPKRTFFLPPTDGYYAIEEYENYSLVKLHGDSQGREIEFMIEGPIKSQKGY